MKNVTTNITMGQVFFILLTVLFSSVMFFYLGAKFGPRMLQLNTAYRGVDEPFFPDEAQIKEVQEILKNNKHKFVFFDELQSNQPITQFPKDVQVTLPVAEKTELAANPEDSTLEAGQALADTGLVKEEVSPKIAQKEPPAEKKETAPIQVGVSEPVLPPEATDLTVLPEAGLTPQSEFAYSLQLGSYSSQSKAQQALDAWKKRGYSVRLIKTTNAGKGLWYRLSLGEYVSQDEALVAQKKIMSAFRQNGRVIKYKK
ncbi:MAG TPA: SPOR domain-containing protein [bacterium]|nr:SPOR domain-containing protein [bacterium]